MVYLDNAATSFPKPERVYEEIQKCMREYCANPGRGGHYMSIKCAKAVYEVREKISTFFNIPDPMQVIFTKNATEALNVGIKGLLKPGDHVITTSMEHNSVIRPLKTLERDIGIEITIVRGNSYGQILAEDIKKAINEKTKLIVATISSNVNGTVLPYKEIGNIADKAGITFLLDGSQGAGSIDIDVQQIKLDIMALPGHKSLLGPQGTGVLYVKNGIKIKSHLQGGTGSKSELLLQPDIFPDSMESGTLNTPGIVGLGAGIDFINSIGIGKIQNYKYMLLKRLYEGICNCEKIKIYSILNHVENSGIISFNFADINSNRISQILDSEFEIATRSGLHCAPLAHETIGTLKQGVVRISIGCFNTIDEIDYTINSIKEISKRIT